MTAYIRFQQNGAPLPGAVRTGAHAGWSELLGFSMGGRTSASSRGSGALQNLHGANTWASTPELQEMTITKHMDASPSALMLAAANTYQGSTTVRSGATRQPVRVPVFLCPSDPAVRGGAYVAVGDIAAEVDFAEAGGRVTGLRVLIHGIRVVRYQRSLGARPFKIVVDPHPTSAGNVTPIEHIAIAYSRMTHAGALASTPDISQDVRGRLLVGSDQGVWRQAATAPQGRLYLGTNQGVF